MPHENSMKLIKLQFFKILSMIFFYKSRLNFILRAVIPNNGIFLLGNKTFQQLNYLKQYSYVQNGKLYLKISINIANNLIIFVKNDCFVL